MDPTLEKLSARVREVVDLRHAASILSWDERVYMPPGGSAARGQALAAIQRLAHERFTSADVGEWLEYAKAHADGSDAHSEATAILAVTARDYDKATRVPASFVSELAVATSAAQHAWRQARAEADFSLFAPHLDTVFRLKRQYVAFFPSTDHPYDALLDDYEPGMKTSEVQAIFAGIRPRQVALIRAIAERPQVDDRLLRLPYSEPALWDFGVEVATAFGFDWTRGRQDTSPHPFTESSGAGDVRITTRFDPQEPFSTLWATMHEAGHALYEQGSDRRWTRTALEGGTSLAVHESQSRLWENLVGRSRPFWEHFFPALQQRFPAELGGATLDEFYRSINRVQPSLIRVEADEATYNLHVMLRVEMEIAMLGGEVAVNDLPELWNEQMREYLGIVPENAAQGILQDVHWADGLVGYFATYTLGNLISVQLWDAFQSVEPSRDDLMRHGDFSPLLSWLRREIHQHGRRYMPQDLVRRVTGSGIDPEPYLQYLERKYREIYGL